MTKQNAIPNRTSDKVLETLFVKHECRDYKWIDSKDIVIAQWVRVKCMFGCPDYGRNACCPPNVPSVLECREFFQEYKKIAMFHFIKSFDNPEGRFAWTRKIDKNLLALESDIFLAGYEKAFALMIDKCGLCEECFRSREECKIPRSARPDLTAFAVDVFSTARKLGYPIQVLTDYRQQMNRYGFLLID